LGLQAHLGDVSIGQMIGLSIFHRAAFVAEGFFACLVHRSYGYPNYALQLEVYESYGRFIDSSQVFVWVIVIYPKKTPHLCIREAGLPSA